MTPEQKKEILGSERFEDFCSKNVSNCGEIILRTVIVADKFYTVKIEAEKAKVEKLKKALSLSVKSAEFFSGHADCKKGGGGYFICRCSFCKESDVKNKDIRDARQVLKEIEG